MKERALKLLLVLVGLALIACIYPLVGALSHPKTTDISLGDQMILGIYFPIGVFLLLAVRNPAANRSLILCFAWSTLAHAAVMWVQAFQHGTVRDDALPLGVIVVICMAVLALAPPKQLAERTSTAGA